MQECSIRHDSNLSDAPALASTSSCPAGNNYKKPEVYVLAPPQAVRQHNFVTWTQYVKYDRLQHLRHEITALTLAIEDMTTERCHFSSSGLLVFTAFRWFVLHLKQASKGVRSSDWKLDIMMNLHSYPGNGSAPLETIMPCHPVQDWPEKALRAVEGASCEAPQVEQG